MNKTNQNQAKQPIPPPNHPKQYRAIGLIRGKYENSSEKLTKGFLIINEQQIFTAVLLGKMICLAENHLDLTKEHLWIVYPHKSEDNFYFQIAGVWEPETLKKDLIFPEINDNLWQVKHGYFSVRGEVIYYARQEQKVIVKIVQSSKKKTSKEASFKLELKGVLPSYCLGHFMNFDVFFENNILLIKKYNDLGFLANRINQNKEVQKSDFTSKSPKPALLKKSNF